MKHKKGTGEHMENKVKQTGGQTMGSSLMRSGKKRYIINKENPHDRYPI
jgi:hypothetical protein